MPAHMVGKIAEGHGGELDMERFREIGHAVLPVSSGPLRVKSIAWHELDAAGAVPPKQPAGGGRGESGHRVR